MRISSTVVQRSHSAFTLIEVLVVVAIIALLIAVLIPSLQTARTQARVVVCSSNASQVNTAVAMYQSTDRGFVPIMLNYHATLAASYQAPARIGLLSVALRREERSLAGLARRESLDQPGRTFNPDEFWTSAMREEYERRYLPAHYLCPFTTDEDSGWRWWQAGVTDAMRRADSSGRAESYHTGMWEDVVRGRQVLSEPMGWGNHQLNGVPQYSVLTWNYLGIHGNRDASSKDIQDRLHRKWGDADIRRLKSGSLSDLTIAYCFMGEHVELGRYWWHVGSHRMNEGGTNALFADGSVRWVRGTRIGWP
jgi:prepilin-type N-terminal cleavage/methylation domain-containing protein/prepilin-type processing-associated H-X9-DG protein